MQLPPARLITLSFNKKTNGDVFKKEDAAAVKQAIKNLLMTNKLRVIIMINKKNIEESIILNFVSLFLLGFSIKKYVRIESIIIGIINVKKFKIL